jgi:hypothetical protein
MGAPVTLTGQYGTADIYPGVGYVDIVPAVSQANAKIVVVQDEVRATLDGDGRFTVDIIASDDPGWVQGPIPYIFREYVDGRVAQWMAYVNAAGPYDISELVPLEESPDFYVPVPGPPNVLTVQSTTTIMPGLPADVQISGTSPSQELNFWIPEGRKGEPGPSGAPHIGPDEPTDPAVMEWFDTDEESPRGVRVDGDTMLGALHLAAGSTAAQPPPGDDSTLVATTAFVHDTVTGDVDLSGLIPKALVDANTILGGLVDDTPVALTPAQAITMQSGQSPVNKVAAAGATRALPATFEMHDVTLNQACILSFDAPAAQGHVFALVLRGAFTPTWPNSVDWSGGSAPSYTTPAVYVFSTVDGGTVWLGAQTGAGYA